MMVIACIFDFYPLFHPIQHSNFLYFQTKFKTWKALISLKSSEIWDFRTFDNPSKISEKDFKLFRSWNVFSRSHSIKVQVRMGSENSFWDDVPDTQFERHFLSHYWMWYQKTLPLNYIHCTRDTNNLLKKIIISYSWKWSKAQSIFIFFGIFFFFGPVTQIFHTPYKYLKIRSSGHFEWNLTPLIQMKLIQNYGDCL